MPVSPAEARNDRGRPEAEDVAQQHTPPPRGVEGERTRARHLYEPGLRGQAPATPRLPDLWTVRRTRRPSSSALTPCSQVQVTAVDGISPHDELRAKLDIPQLDPELLQLALTHRSFAYEAGGLPTNERLEFLGDSVLGVIVTDALYRRHPDLSEGRLARLRSAVVNARALASVARTLDLGDYLRLGRGEESTGGRDKSSILADALEALIGAVYLDCPFAVTSGLVLRLFDPLMDAAVGLGAGLDWKTSLQELCATLQLGVPDYTVDESGPDHEKSFVARARVAQEVYAEGLGTSKKEAEQHAAEAAWRAVRAAYELDTVDVRFS
jgi:ribonuclease-3